MRRHQVLSLVLVGCHDVAMDPAPIPDASVQRGCLLTANTTPTSTVTSGCALVERDTSSCEADRKAMGLTGFWLKFSCRVVITKPTADTIQLASDGQPDHTSNYFPVGNDCRVDYQPPARNPNVLAVKMMKMTVPLAPTLGGRVMMLGTVGVAVNGVSLFNNMAAPGDDIYAESKSFDQCQGHPTGMSTYHYHSEPYSITYDDAKLVGAMMDGLPVYGRRDADGSLPVLDGFGGHMGATPDSATPVYHYHINSQTSTAGETVWFITKGKYAATPGTCAGCQ